MQCINKVNKTYTHLKTMETVNTEEADTYMLCC